MSSVIDWLLTPEFWAVLGIVFIMIELFVGGGIAFSLGLTALLHSVLFLIDDKIFIDLSSLLLSYGVTSIIFAILMHWYFRNRDKTNDVNEY